MSASLQDESKTEIIRPGQGKVHHPDYPTFWVQLGGSGTLLDPGNSTQLEVGSGEEEIGQYDTNSLPEDTWVSINDQTDSSLPIEARRRKSGAIYVRWLTPEEGQTGNTASDQSVDQAEGSATDFVSSLFGSPDTSSEASAASSDPRVEDFIDATGCILGIVWSQSQLQWFRDQVPAMLAEPEGPDAQWIESQIATFEPVKNAGPRDRNLWREQNQPAFLEALEHPERLQLKRRGFLTMLLTWKGQAAAILAWGTPPLTREAAESQVELGAFAAEIAQGRDPLGAIPPDVEAQIGRLAREYPQLPADERSQIALAPILLYELRRSWPSLSMPERQAVQKQLAARFRRGKVPGGDANPGARVESPSAAGDWDRFRDPNSLKQLQKRFQSASEAGDPDAVKIMEQIQQKLQSEKLAATMLTNMASLRMEMLMNTARAIRS